MWSSIVSTMLMFVSEKTYFLFLILMGLFFLVYVDPYEWRKKRKERHSKAGRAKRARQSSEMDKLNALKDAGLLTEEEYRARKREINHL